MEGENTNYMPSAPPKTPPQQNNQPTQQIKIIYHQNPPPQQNMNNIVVNVNNKRKVNHPFYCCATIFTGGICSICWVGSCIGCCPTCN